MADGRVVIDTSLDTSKLNKQVNTLKGNLSRGLAAVGKAGALALGAATAAVTAFSVSAVKDLVTFENKMNEVFTLIPGASQEAKDAMIADVKDLAKEMGVLPEDVIPAVYQALSAGVPQDNVFSFVETATKLAKAGVAELDDSVGVLSTVVNNYADMGLTAEEASNMLFTTVKNGVTTIPELSTKLGDVVPIASALGINFGEVSASMATMTSTMGAGSTTKAVTNLRGMLNELGKEGSQADKAFRDVAGIGFTEFIEKGGTLEEAMGVLRTASEQNNTAINNLFGSIEAGQAALILAGDGADKLAMNMDAMAGSAGATDEAFETMASGSQFAIDRIMANIDVLKLNFAEQFAPAFDTLLTSVLGVFDGTEGAVEDFAETLGTVLTDVFGTILDTAVDLLPELVDAASDMLSSLIDGLTSDTQGLSDAVLQIVMSIIDFIVVNLPKIIDGGVRLAGSLIVGIVKATPEILASVATLVRDMVKELVDMVPDFMEVGRNIVQGLTQGLKDFMSRPVDAIKETGEKMWTGIKGFFGVESPSKLFAWLGRMLGLGLAQGIEDETQTAVDAGTGMGEGVANGVNTGIANVKGSVQQQWNDIIDGMTENTQVAAGIMKSALESTLSSFTELGTALYEGGVGWQNFAKIALGALSDILMSLGHELAARAALAAVSFNWTGAALATVGAAAAYTAAGLIDGWANSYDVGGIIKQDQLANIHKGETILPAGITADMRSAGLEIRPLGGGARDIVVNGVLEVDGRRLAKAVFRYTDENVGLSYV